MSKYTTMVRYICENAAGVESGGFTDVDEILNQAIPKVFNFNFPIWDEGYREILCRKILKHYYMREICCETVGLWKLFLDRKLNEIMPYYNQLYKSTILEFNPLYDVDITTTTNKSVSGENTRTDVKSGSQNSEYSGSKSIAEEYEDTNDVTENKSKTSSGQNSSEESVTETKVKVIDDDGSFENSGSENVVSNSNNDSLVKFADTPQGGLTGLLNDEYLTTATKTDSTSGGTDVKTTSGSGTNTLDRTENEDNSIDRNASGTHSNTETESNSVTGNNSGNKESSVSDSGNRTVTSSENNNGTEQHQSTEDFLQTVIGSTGGKSYSQRVLEYRETFINIDMMIINELRTLFMQIW